MVKRIRLFGVAALAATWACSGSNIFGLGARDAVATIIFFGDTSHISAPDTVARGVSFDVTFRSFAGGCTRAVAHDDLFITGTSVEIRPFDRSNGGSVCTSDLLFLTHTVPVRLDTPGTYTVRVIGAAQGPAGNGNVELTRPITVK